MPETMQNSTSPKPSGCLNTRLPYPKAKSHLANEVQYTTPSRNSSLQKVWNEDYYDSDAVEEPSLQSPPEPASHSLFNSISAAQESRRSEVVGQKDSPKPRSSLKSGTDLLPLRTSRPSFSLDRPTEENTETEFMPTFTGDGVIKVADKSRGGVSSWFTGSSTPMSLPFGEKSLPEPPSNTSSRSVSPERPTPQRRPTLLQTNNGGAVPSPKVQTGMFGGFFSKPREETRPLPTDVMKDELLTLDINAALFPDGTAADPFSPASFKNLRLNAEGLLQRLQSAYKSQTLLLHEARIENSVMEEELEEADTRTQMLKSQLEEMASKAQESDAALVEMAAELSKEKKARREEKEAREKSIALVKGNARAMRPQSLGIEVDEDLGISDAISPGVGKDRKVWRGSADMSTEGESDAESFGGESVFSRSRSPTFTMNSVSTRDSTPEIHQAQFARILPNTNPPSQRPKQLLQQRSTFQKIMQGISTSTVSPTVDKDPYGGIGMGGDGCSNCLGKAASVAWDTVGLLRAENQGLKAQVATLDDCIEGALALTCFRSL
jgi:hypothetical protein